MPKANPSVSPTAAPMIAAASERRNGRARRGYNVAAKDAQSAPSRATRIQAGGKMPRIVTGIAYSGVVLTISSSPHNLLL